MSPLNRGPMAPRTPPAMGRPPRYGRIPPPLPMGMNRGMLPPPPTMNPMFNRGRPPIPPPMGVPPGPLMNRGGPPPPMFGPRRPLPPMPMPPMGMRGPMGIRPLPGMRPGLRGILPPHALPHMRPRFPSKNKSPKKANNKSEDLELKKPWMTDEIRIEIQKKNKLYAKAKKNKDAKEWEEFKDLRNKVTRMIRDAKNEYLAKNPDQAHLYESDDAKEDNNDSDANDLDSDSDQEPVSPYCEVCDRDFQSDQMLQKHIQEHKICEIDGCTFTAHPKIVEKHISMQHNTGLYKRMKNFMSKEDTEKWREERKRRHPCSIDNQNLLEAEKNEREKRGEIINKKNKRFRSPVRSEKAPRSRKRRRNNRTFREPIFEETKLETYRGLLPFAGTGMLNEKETSLNDDFEMEKSSDEIKQHEIEISDEEDQLTENKDSKISDDEYQLVENKDSKISDEELVEENNAIEPEKPQVESVLTQSFSLVADYGTDSDNDDPPDELPIQKIKLEENENFLKVETQPQNVNQVQEMNSVIDKEVSQQSQLFPADLVIDENNERDTKESMSTIKNKKTVPKKNDKRHKNSKQPQKCNKKQEVSSYRLKLLNNLLERSIQHERNTIFQCITYIANNNFFD